MSNRSPLLNRCLPPSLASVLLVLMLPSSGWCLAVAAPGEVGRYWHVRQAMRVDLADASPSTLGLPEGSARPDDGDSRRNTPANEELDRDALPIDQRGPEQVPPGVDDLRPPLPENGVPADTARAIYLSTVPLENISLKEGERLEDP